MGVRRLLSRQLRPDQGPYAAVLTASRVSAAARRVTLAGSAAAAPDGLQAGVAPAIIAVEAVADRVVDVIVLVVVLGGIEGRGGEDLGDHLLAELLRDGRQRRLGEPLFLIAAIEDRGAIL